MYFLSLLFIILFVISRRINKHVVSFNHVYVNNFFISTTIECIALLVIFVLESRQQCLITKPMIQIGQSIVMLPILFTIWGINYNRWVIKKKKNTSKFILLLTDLSEGLFMFICYVIIMHFTKSYRKHTCNIFKEHAEKGKAPVKKTFTMFKNFEISKATAAEEQEKEDEEQQAIEDKAQHDRKLIEATAKAPWFSNESLIFILILIFVLLSGITWLFSWVVSFFKNMIKPDDLKPDQKKFMEHIQKQSDDNYKRMTNIVDGISKKKLAMKNTKTKKTPITATAIN
jgi:hypothetical protein